MKLFSNLGKKKNEIREEETIDEKNESQSSIPEEHADSKSIIIKSAWRPLRFEDVPYAISNAEVTT